MTASKFITKTITAQNTFTDIMQIDKGQSVAVSISGISSTTVTLQRRYNAAGDWRDISTYTADAEFDYLAATGMEIRLGVKTGDFGSGTVIIDMKVG